MVKRWTLLKVLEWSRKASSDYDGLLSVFCLHSYHPPISVQHLEHSDTKTASSRDEEACFPSSFRSFAECHSRLHEGKSRWEQYGD